MKKERFVMVTDKIEGVYFGMSDVGDGDSFAVLTQARLCFHWVADSGIGDLTVVGPKSGSKIGPTMKRICVNNIANVFELEPEALKVWHAAKWE